jgi:hypothetical protein
MYTFPFPSRTVLLYTNDIPQVEHPKIGQVLRVTGFAATDALPPIACGHTIGQVLKATGLPTSEGCPV